MDLPLLVILPTLKHVATCRKYISCPQKLRYTKPGFLKGPQKCWKLCHMILMPTVWICPSESKDTVHKNNIVHKNNSKIVCMSHSYIIIILVHSPNQHTRANWHIACRFSKTNLQYSHATVPCYLQTKRIQSSNNLILPFDGIYNIIQPFFVFAACCLLRCLLDTDSCCMQNRIQSRWHI